MLNADISSIFQNKTNHRQAYRKQTENLLNTYLPSNILRYICKIKQTRQSWLTTNFTQPLPPAMKME